MKCVYYLLVCLTVGQTSHLAAQDACPDFDEFDRKVQMSIEVLDTNSPTENGARKLLKDLQAEVLTSVKLQRTWSYLHETLGGGNWRGVKREIRDVGLMIGEMNIRNCLSDYNNKRRASAKEVNNSAKHNSPIDSKREVVSAETEPDKSGRSESTKPIYRYKDSPYNSSYISEVRGSIYWLIVLVFIFQSIVIFQLSRIIQLLKTKGHKL